LFILAGSTIHGSDPLALIFRQQTSGAAITLGGGFRLVNLPTSK